MANTFIRRLEHFGRMLLSALVVSLCFPLSVYSGYHQTLHFKHFGVKDGLTINPVEVIFQDSQGYMWFGSRFGLWRYDGDQFQTYRSEPQNPNSLSNNHITAIVEDRNNNLWIGTENGLNQIDPFRDTITHYFHDSSNPSSLNDNFITCLYVAEDGVIWIGTNAGFNRMDPGQKRFESFWLPPGSKTQSIKCICEDSEGFYWIGAANGLFRFDLNQEMFREFTNRLCDVSETLFTMHRSNDGTLWLGTWHCGLIRVDTQRELFYLYPNTEEISDSDKINQDVRSIYEAPDGILWLGTASGICRFDPKTNTVWHDNYNPDRPYGLTSNSVNQLYADRSGGIWVATYNELSYYAPTSYPFKHLYHTPDNANSLSANAVYALCEGHDGSIWIGTYLGGLNGYSPETQTIQHYLNDPNNPHTIQENTITALCTDPTGKIWIGAWTRGLSLFDPNTRQFKRFPFDADCKRDPEGKILCGAVVRAIAIDRDNKVWIGTEHGTINIYDPQTERFTYYEQALYPNYHFLFKDKGVFSLLVDRANTVWVGTGGYAKVGFGFYRFDRSTRTFEHHSLGTYPVAPREPVIMDIIQDRQGDLWFGSEIGLSRYNPRSEQLKTYTPIDGFLDHQIASIVESNEGLLWVSTRQSGLSLFNPETETIRNFNLADGLRDLHYLCGVGLKSRDGTIYLGGMGGVTIVDKGTIPVNQFKPPVVIQSVRILDRPIPLNDIRSKKPLEFPYWKNYIEFEFASLNFTNPEKNQYRYRLLGLDENWIDSGHQRTARYTHLPSGTYTFQVLGSNNDGIWNPIEASLTFTIQPPFWLTWWFRGIALLAITAFFGSIYYIRIQRIKRVNEQLETEISIRTKQLKSNFEYLDNIIQKSPYIILGFTPEGFVTFINPAGKSILNIDEVGIHNQKWWDIISVGHGRQKLEQLHHQISSPHFNDSEVSFTLPSGENRSTIWNFVQHRDEEGSIVEFLAFGKDITEQIEKEILETSSREQRRIGQELHDSICQSLRGITFLCESIAVEKERLSTSKASALDKMYDHLHKVTEQSRNLARGLYLHELENNGLVEALKTLTSTIESMFGIRCTFSCTHPVRIDDIGVATHLFRIVQEAISNAVKYSQSDRIDLTVSGDPTTLCLQVHDSGIGFQRHALTSRGMGLSIMQCRARMIHATLSIDSVPDEGTTVLCTLDLNESKNNLAD